MIPNAPYIRSAESLGTDNVDEPECPVCGDFCKTVYRNDAGSVIGCDRCVQAMDAYEWDAEEKASYVPDWLDERRE